MELSVENFATRTGMTVQAVYKKIKLNQLKTVRKSVNNRLKTFIQIEEVEEGIKLVERQNTTLTQPADQNILLQSQSEAIVNNQIQQSEYLELIKRMYADNASLSERNSQLSELAGQAKLLTDSEHRTKQEYFKIVQENKQLLQEKTIVETENMLINKQLEELKQKLDNVEKKENNNWWSKL